MADKYAHQKNPNGKYKEGTIIEIKGQPIKRDNGIFMLTAPFPKQKGDDQYFQYERILKNGEISKASGTGLRGMWGKSLDKHAKILKDSLPKKKSPSKKAKKPMKKLIM